MLRPTQLTPATALTIVTLADAKAFMKIEYTDEDAMITTLINAAESYLDGYSGILGRALLTQTWEQKVWNFYDCAGVIARFPYIHKIRLPVCIASSIDSIKYFDTDNVEQTLAASVYQLLTDDGGSYVSLKPNQSWPNIFYREDAITIQWKAGYGAAQADVPAAIRQAMLQLIAHWFEYRGVILADKRMEVIPMSVDALLAPFRRVGL